MEIAGEKYNSEEIASPFGVNTNEFKRAQKLARKIYQISLKSLVLNLKQQHNCSYGKRFWEILIGPWLEVFVNALTHRALHLKKIDSLYNDPITHITFPNSDIPSNIVTLTTIDFINSTNDPIWNNIILAQLISILNLKNIRNRAVIPSRFPCIKNHRKQYLSSKKKWYGFFSRFLNKRLFANGKVLIFESYLSLPKEMLLNLRLGNLLLPHVFDDRFLYLTPPNNISRFKEISSLISMICAQLPVCYRENFQLLERTVGKEFDHSRIGLCYTVGGARNSEYFKYIAARVADRGGKYVVGQHGNSYGVHTETSRGFEMNSPDFFFSWGWTCEHAASQVLPIGKFTSGIQKQQRSSKHFGKDNHILIVVRGHGDRYDLRDKTYDYYFQHAYLKNIIKCLVTESDKNVLTIRGHNNRYNTILNDDLLSFIDQFDSRVRYDDGAKRFCNVASDFDLVVFTYDSTGFLECLEVQQPALMMFQDFDGRLFPEVRPDYEALASVGLWLHTGEIRKLLEIVCSIDSWWSSDSVRKVVSSYASKYCKILSDSSKELSKSLLTLGQG
ncbi:hypothetical protein N9M22_06040 [Litoricolaceae bacterium]|nr:hypothetical protein [Litorivicinaceae bacterium]